MESICLGVMDAKKSRFIVSACYRSPKFCKVTDFVSLLSSATELMLKSRNELMQLGDFNNDMNTDANKGKAADPALLDFCDRFCLDNQITEPTRVTDNTKSHIDVILVSQSERYANCGNLHLGVSDHDFIYTVRKNKLPRSKPREIVYRSMKKFNEDEFLSDLNSVPWETSYVFDDVDDLWDHWHKLYNNVLDEQAPLKRKHVRGDQLPWITSSIQ